MKMPLLSAQRKYDKAAQDFAAAALRAFPIGSTVSVQRGRGKCFWALVVEGPRWFSDPDRLLVQHASTKKLHWVSYQDCSLSAARAARGTKCNCGVRDADGDADGERRHFSTCPMGRP